MSYTPRAIRPLIDRFWEKVNKDTGSGCWEWTGCKTPLGYGHIGLGRRGSGYAIASRVSWEIHNGPVPRGMKVLHTCDNPPCVNPAHLFLGTQADNVKDCLNKGRANYKTLSGSDNGNAKLTAANVLAIREKYASGKILQRELAMEYGITQTHVSYLIREKSWRHLVEQN